MAEEGEPTVPVVCEACGTESDVALSEVSAVVERHNDTVHDGAEKAGVDPAVADELANLVATDLGLLDE